MNDDEMLHLICKYNELKREFEIFKEITERDLVKYEVRLLKLHKKMLSEEVKDD